MWKKVISSIGVSSFDWKTTELKKKKGNRSRIDIAKNYNFFDRFTKYKASYGKRVRFWEGGLLDQAPLMFTFPDLYPVSNKK